MTGKSRLLPALMAAVSCAGASATQAETNNNHNGSQSYSNELDTVEVVESVAKAESFSGSTAVIDKQTMERDQIFTVNEALRKAPGVYVRDEEGLGLRPNIGIRGQNPFRSTKVLFLEDGLPFNFAPYGDNDIYYHPPIERYDGIEIYKGADLTQFGPQTINGAINYLTPKVPNKPGGFVNFMGGNRDYLKGHVRYGGMFKDLKGVDAAGGVIDFIHKEGLGNRDYTFARIDDVNLKTIIDIDANNRLTLRGDYYEQDEQATFGMTDAEYRILGAQYNPDKNASFITDRWSTSATLEHSFNQDVSLETSFYWSTFHRHWWRQMNQQPTDTNCDVAGGYVGYQEDRLSGRPVDNDNCNFNRGRLREYETWGIAPTLHARHDLFGVESQLDAGFRAHFESQHRRTVDGNSPTARDGNVIEFNQRFADAYSGFLQNKFIWNAWTFTPGVRVESIAYQRKNLLTGAEGGNSMTEILPSFAMTFDPIDEATLFFGIHRGFAPPRVEDSVYNNTGGPIEIGPEISWNAEFGIRARPLPGIKSELTYFHNDFDTLTVLGTVGGNDTPVAQGRALYEGIELMTRVDAGELLNWNHNPYAQIAYTWLPTAETLSAFRCLPQSDGSMSARCPGGNVYGSAPGKRAPYAPENLLTATLGYSHADVFDAHLEAVFVGEQFADFMNLQSGLDHPNGAGSIEARSGQYGKINDYVVLNFAASYKIHRDLTLYVAMKNMLDNTYIVDRVRGIQPGMPRLVQAGFKYAF